MYNRKIRLVTVRVWPRGISHDEMADHLEHVAEQVRMGCYQGEVCPDSGSGWWETFETDPTNKPTRRRQRDRAAAMEV